MIYRYRSIYLVKAGQELAPRLAHRLGGSAAGDAVDVKVADGRMLVTRGVYGGKATAVIATPRSPGVVWGLASGPMAPAEVRASGEVERIRLGLVPDSRVGKPRRATSKPRRERDWKMPG